MLLLGWMTACVQLCYYIRLFLHVPMAWTCKLATELRTSKSVWEMRGEIERKMSKAHYVTREVGRRENWAG